MLICIDFDGTYTADPLLWDAFIENARKCGHVVVCATMRYEEEGGPVHHFLDGKVDQIIFTSRKAKKAFLRKEGLQPNIWIDDNPDWLYEDAK